MTVVSIRVIPKSSRNQVEVLADGTLKVKTTAPPVDGEANVMVIEILAKFFAINRSSVSIQSGHTSKLKRVVLEGISEESVQAKIDQANLGL